MCSFTVASSQFPAASSQFPVPSELWKLVTGNWKLDTKTRPAPARRLRVRVIEDEAAADQRRVVVERGSLNELIALGIDKHLRAVGPLEHVIAFARCRFPGKGVAQTGAATGFDPDAKTAAWNAIPRGHLVDQRSGVIADLKHGVVRPFSVAHLPDTSKSTTRTVLY